MFWIGNTNLKFTISLLSLLLFTSPSILLSEKYLFPTVNPIQCYSNPYIDKLLDALRYVESSDGKYVLNINYKHGKEISRDEGPYQHNSKCIIIFSNLYNDGKRYDPYDEEVSRRISRQILLDNYNYCGNWFDALVAYNCGLGQWELGAPYKSYKFANKIMRIINKEMDR